MTNFDYDLFVIGGGSGGVRAARMSAGYGAKVGLAEEYRYGGTCVIRGCVPKKLLVYASSFSEMFEDSRGYGWSEVRPTFDWSKMHGQKEAEITRLEGIYKANLERAGVEIFHTRATVTSPHSVKLADGAEFAAKHILIATGGTPFVPEIEGADLAITSNEIFDIDQLPERAMVVGGGYIASEFAGILNGMGVKVTQVYRRDPILRGFDEDIRTHVQDAMRGRGVEILTREDVDRIAGKPGALTVHLTSGSSRQVGLVLYATGRVPNTGGLGLEEAGVRLTGNGAVQVDDWSQSSIPSIYAVGDVTDRLALTPVAIREGAAFAETVFNATPTKPDHSMVATAVFTQPEIGTVGLTEDQARAEGEIEVYRSAFRPMLNILAGRDEKMLMKLIADKETDRVRGVHIVGHGAGEMIQMAAIAVKMGATKADFDRTVAVHPTAAEELVTMKEPVA
ncbi:MAG: glutathione-disulfide reductase [Paracoccaceae bacterium]|nr:glutathione-disulfide reductase [Paracoccaceae bacterium]